MPLKKGSKMRDVNGSLKGVKRMYGFLENSEIVEEMKRASDEGKAVLLYVHEKIEDEFGRDSDFPVVQGTGYRYATFKQNVGRMVKRIMDENKYEPVIDNNTKKTCREKIPRNPDRVKGFSSSAIYKRKDENE